MIVRIHKGCNLKDDREIEYDEEIDELEITSGIVQLSWEEKAKKAQEHSKRLKDGDRDE